MDVASELTICIFYTSVKVLLCWASSQQLLYETAQNLTVEVAFYFASSLKKARFYFCA